jgi:DNA-binding XRE family transcriptional regulator
VGKPKRKRAPKLSPIEPEFQEDQLVSKYAHQDYKPIVLVNPSIKKKIEIDAKTEEMRRIGPVRKDTKNNRVGTASSKEVVQRSAKKVEERATEGDYRRDTVSGSLSEQMRQARAAIGLTQDQLAQQCNFPKQIIRDYENGTAIKNHAELAKISQVLHVKFR